MGVHVSPLRVLEVAQVSGHLPKLVEELLFGLKGPKKSPRNSHSEA